RLMQLAVISAEAELAEGAWADARKTAEEALSACQLRSVFQYGDCTRARLWWVEATAPSDPAAARKRLDELPPPVSGEVPALLAMEIELARGVVDLRAGRAGARERLRALAERA